MDENRLRAAAENVMKLARNTVGLELRFLDGAMEMLAPEQYHGSAGTDGIKLYYDPLFILRAYRKSDTLPARWYLHELLHCIFRHWLVDSEIDREIWDLSCDIAVESVINELKGVSQGDEAAKLKAQAGALTAERIYGCLIQNRPKGKKLARMREQYPPDDHSMWYEPQSRTAAMYGHGGNKADCWKSVSERIQTDLSTFSSRFGMQAGTLTQGLNAVNREKYSYAEFLRKFAVVRETARVSSDEFDYIYYSYGLEHYSNMPLIEPLEYREDRLVHDFVIAIDTSGSTMGGLVQTFIRKTYNILMQSESFCSRFNIHIVQCDAAIQEDKKLTSRQEMEDYIRHMELKGSGGTDFRPLFSYVDSLADIGEFSDLRGLILLTDGCGMFPERMPAYKTAVALIDGEYSEQFLPPWAIRLFLDKENISRCDNEH